MNKVTTEIFAVGKWNGSTFSLDDLNKIVESFNYFKSTVPTFKVPLKFGHNDEQPMTDGQPAIGWVDNIFIEGKKLIGEFSDVPDIVKKAIDKKLYRKVSIELDMDVEYKAQHYPFVLSGVALLGADLPAVSVLDDLNAYLGEGSLAASRQVDVMRLAYTRRATFSAIDGQATKEKTKMNEEDVKKLIAASHQALTEQVAKLSEDYAKVKSRNEELEAELSKRDAAKNAEAVQMSRGTVNKILEDAVKDGRILPAQREQFTKLMKINDDNEVTKIDIDEVKAFVGEGKKMNYSKDSAKSGSDDARVFADAGEQLDYLAKQEQDKVPTMKYSRALELAMHKNPELAKEYLGGTDNG